MNYYIMSLEVNYSNKQDKKRLKVLASSLIEATQKLKKYIRRTYKNLIDYDVEVIGVTSTI